jgi:predicted nucleic acid-binding protein
MPAKAVVDSGPLVALFDGRDADHARVVSFLKSYRGRLHSTLAVVTEVVHLLDFSHDAQHDFLSWFFGGAVRCLDLTDDDAQRAIALHAKYADRPMDFADATLIAIAERLEIREALTLDSDFRFYRFRNRQAFITPLLEVTRG